MKLPVARLSGLLLCAHAVVAGPSSAAPREVDLRRAAAAGIRMVEGPRLRLLTDLPPSEAVDELPEVFAAAVPQWAEYFGVDPARLESWQMQGYLIADRQKFAALDLLPAEKPDFANGYADGFELWLVDQPSDYYRRHLLLHEGTHGFMATQLGSCGPGWFMEGTAELLGTHQWRDGKLTLGVVPPNRDAAGMWGRVKAIRESVAEGETPPLAAVLQIDNTRRLNVHHYAWTWALAAMLENTPAYRLRFHELQDYVNAANFNEHFRRLYVDDWRSLRRQWRVTVSELDYGYDFRRMAIVERDVRPVAHETASEIAADRGWQSTGWLLAAGKSYQVAAKGRYQVAVDPPEQGGRPWPSEPGGVTIEYHQGHPLGALLGALEPIDGKPADEPSFAQPVRIGRGRRLQPQRDAVLYLRVNDSPARLDDNRGRLRVTINPDSAPGP